MNDVDGGCRSWHKANTPFCVVRSWRFNQKKFLRIELSVTILLLQRVFHAPWREDLLWETGRCIGKTQKTTVAHDRLENPHLRLLSSCSCLTRVLVKLNITGLSQNDSLPSNGPVPSSCYNYPRIASCLSLVTYVWPKIFYRCLPGVTLRIWDWGFLFFVGFNLSNKHFLNTYVLLGVFRRFVAWHGKAISISIQIYYRQVQSCIVVACTIRLYFIVCLPCVSSKLLCLPSCGINALTELTVLPKLNVW